MKCRKSAMPYVKRRLLRQFIVGAVWLLPGILLADTNLSREYSIFNFGHLTSSPNAVEAISREVSLFNFNRQYPTTNGVEAIAREVSVFNFSPRTTVSNGLEAISREVSLFDFAPHSTSPNGVDVIGREVSLFNFNPRSSAPNGVEANSREYSVFSFARQSSAPNGVDAVAREVSFYNYGSNGVTIAIGSAIVPFGTTGSVAVTFSTLIPLTNVLVAVGFPPNSLTNWTVAPQSPLTSSTFVSNNNELYVSFSSPIGQSITTNLQQLGQIVFTPGSNQPSAFLPLLVDGVTSKIQNGTVATQTDSAQNGEVIVLNKTPLLRWAPDSNGVQFVTLYGYTGTNYTIESTPNLRTPVLWTPVYTNLTPSNFIAFTPNVIKTNPVMLFRAKQ